MRIDFEQRTKTKLKCEGGMLAHMNFRFHQSFSCNAHECLPLHQQGSDPRVLNGVECLALCSITDLFR